MLKVFTVVLAGYVVWGFPGQQQVRIPKDRIVGGHDANIEDYPYQLALLLYNQHYCGAALIEPDWAITAAHCVDHGLFDTLVVRAGSSIKSSGGQVVKVSRVIIHPKYDAPKADYDIALLQLEEPVTAENAAAIRLPAANETAEEGDKAVVSGWGTLEYDGETPDILQVVEVPVVAYDTCKEIYGDLLTEAMFCAGLLNEGGKDACQGDSGGPLVIDRRLAGIISWGSKCATPSFPGVYADVAHVVDWIQEQLNGPSSTTEPGPGPSPGPSSPSPGPSPSTSGPSPPSPGPSSPSPGPEPTSPPPSPPSPGPSPSTSGPSPPSPGPSPGPSSPSPGPSPGPSSPSPGPSPGPSSPSPGPSPGPSSPSTGPSPPSPGSSSPSPGTSPSSPSPPSPPPSSSSPVPEPPTTVEPDTSTPGSFSFLGLLKLFRG